MIALLISEAVVHRSHRIRYPIGVVIEIKLDLNLLFMISMIPEVVQKNNIMFARQVPPKPRGLLTTTM